MTPQQYVLRKRIMIGLAIILLGLLYLPINLADDVLPIIGQLDDIGELVIEFCNIIWIGYNLIQLINSGRAKPEDAHRAVGQIILINQKPKRSKPVRQVGRITIHKS